MFSNLSLMFKLNVVAIIFGEIWQLRECSSGAILLVFVDNRANFPTHTMHRSAVVYSVLFTTHLYIIDCHFKHIEPRLMILIFLDQKLNADSKNISFKIFFC